MTSAGFASELSIGGTRSRRLRYLLQVAIISVLCIPAVWFLADHAGLPAPSA